MYSFTCAETPSDSDPKKKKKKRDDDPDRKKKKKDKKKKKVSLLKRREMKNSRNARRETNHKPKMLSLEQWKEFILMLSVS